jgi:hypothetical protein
LEVEVGYWWSNLDLVTLGMDVPIIIIMWSLELGEHKRLIISFPTSLCLLTKNVNDLTPFFKAYKYFKIGQGELCFSD